MTGKRQSPQAAAAAEWEFVQSHRDAAKHHGTRSWFLIDSNWLRRWRQYCTEGALSPGPITNHELLDRSGDVARPLPGLIAGDDYRGVSHEVWHYLQARHGGGPALISKGLDIYYSELQIHRGIHAVPKREEVDDPIDLPEATASRSTVWSFSSGSSGQSVITGFFKNLMPKRAASGRNVAAASAVSSGRSKDASVVANQELPMGTSWPAPHQVKAADNRAAFCLHAHCQAPADNDDSHSRGSTKSSESRRSDTKTSRRTIVV